MARKRNRDRKTTNAALPVMRPDAAGIDIGATEIFVAVPMDRAAENVRSFPTFTQDLYIRADWLAECGVKTVAMESTGVYWIPMFQNSGRPGFGSMPGERAPCKERARPPHGRVRLPVVAVLTFGRAIAALLPARAGSVRRPFAVAAPGKSGANGRHLCQSYAEGARSDEPTTASCN